MSREPPHPRTNNHRPRAKLRVGGSLIRIPIPGRSTIQVEPEIRHRSRMNFSGFGQLESYEYGRFQHSVEAVIPRDSLEDWALASGVRNPPTWDDLLALEYPGTQPHLRKDDPAFIVARIEVEEHPRFIRQRLNVSWGDWLRAIDADSGRVGDILDQLEATAGEPAPVDGSLFHVRMVAVHPAFRGQAIRRRLVAHTLWTMHRARGDVAIILVIPGINPLGPETRLPDRSAEAIRARCRYYQRMGFIRSLPGRITPGEAAPMHIFFGREPLLVSGLHEIGVE